MDGGDPSPPEPMMDDDLEMDSAPTLERTSDMLIDALMLAGVRKEHAQGYAASVMKLEKNAPTVVEVYGRGGIVSASNGPHKSLNIKGLDALDLTTLKKSGDYWDFSRKRDRDEARRMIADLRPTWVIGSPL